MRTRAEFAALRPGAVHASTRDMQPPADHLSYNYPHDEILDRPRRVWPALLVAMIIAMLALFIVLVR